MTQALENAGFILDEGLKKYYALEAQALKHRFTIEPVEDNEYREEPFLTASSIGFQASLNDVAVVVFGRQAGEGKDRHVENDFELSATERELLVNLNKAYRPRGKRVVVVLNVGGVVETASWKHLVDAILLPWAPGQEGANAIADVLTGKVNPSGKLPMTFPCGFLDIPSSADFPYDYDPLSPYHAKENVDFTSYSEDIWVGYRYFQTAGAEVSYPFGHGLSYTSFGYSKPVVKAGPDGFTASVTVTNTGDVAGKEVVQLYVGAPAGGLEKPVYELKGFAKTRLLQPGESQVLTMKVDNYSLASFNELTSAWEAAEGAYRILFGASSADIRATASYQLKKPLSWPVNDVFKMQRGDFFPAVKDAAPLCAGEDLRNHDGHHLRPQGAGRPFLSLFHGPPQGGARRRLSAFPPLRRRFAPGAGRQARSGPRPRRRRIPGGLAHDGGWFPPAGDRLLGQFCRGIHRGGPEGPRHLRIQSACIPVVP